MSSPLWGKSLTQNLRPDIGFFLPGVSRPSSLHKRAVLSEASLWQSVLSYHSSFKCLSSMASLYPGTKPLQRNSVPFRKRLVLFCQRKRQQRKKTRWDQSLSLHSALTINTTMLVKRWEEGKTFTVHTCLTKEAETVIKTTALLMIC